MALVCRILSYAWGFSAYTSSNLESISYLSIPYIWQFVLNFFILLLSAFGIARFSSFYLSWNEEKIRHFFFLMLLLLSTNPIFFPIQSYSILIIPFFLFVFSFSPTYGSNKSHFKFLDIGVCIGASTLIWSPFLLLIPLAVFQFYSAKSFSLKNIVAFFLGIFLPFWILSPLLLLPDIKLFFFDNLKLLLDWDFSFPSTRVASFTWLYPFIEILLYLIAVIHLQLTYTKESVEVGFFFLIFLISLYIYSW